MEFKNKYSTPIHKLNETYNNNTFYIKREDLLPFSFGGNKARKAELFFQDFINKKANCLVTYGTSSSNHCRVIANIASSKKIPCYIVSPSESSYRTINKQMLKLFGAKIIECPVNQVSLRIESLINELKINGYKPYFIPGGGHGNIGTEAYVSAYKEIVVFENSEGVYFDYIFLISGTGTTQAGLVCGKHIYGDKRKKIIGISNARRNPYGKNIVEDSVNEYISEKKLPPISSNEIIFLDDFVLNGYGSFNDEIVQTIKNVLVNDGIALDPIYTGKAYSGMKNFIKKNKIREKNILFIHTGGTPLFFDKLKEIF